MKDYTGVKFGTLTAIKPTTVKGNRQYWLCKCECGNLTEIRCDHMFDGRIKSCGCKKYEYIGNAKRIHGKKHTRIYRIYQNMKNRCYNKNFPEYKRYGARGISICEEWLIDRCAFFDWAFKNGYTDELTLDRIDVNGNYEPSNCRWITILEQQNNRRTNHFVSYGNKRLTLADWSRELNIPYWKIQKHIKKHKSLDNLISKGAEQ